ncbi:hypothetical protein QTP86_021609 [Hemibagrus guttatus]|nr:hypothetical protein QTP86_021609 [Hemibagrus guttatus]
MKDSNFYWRFIRNYSSVAGPLTSLLKGKPRRLAWTDQAQAAFQRLKECFTMGPILRHPDPDLPIVVEADALSSGIGAVLSQRHSELGKLHPCAFYSQKLTAAETNYDVSNRELLSIKAALEEWRHWLEGVRHPFLVLTDHRNLEYLRGAKWLNPRQARWALFFTRFQFSVTYRPGSKNCKADVLSRQFEASSKPVQPDLILPVTAILAPVRWSLMEEIRRAHTDKPLPAGCPATKGPSFDPTCSSQVLVAITGDRCGKLCTGMSDVCAVSGHLPVDFLTDLPDSGGFTTVMVMVDRFSKGCKLIPLKGSPTAMQTAEAMFQHVFRNFGLPEDIVSDRGPQFTSRVWGSLCAQLGIGVSLSSGYHPQSNGQAECPPHRVGQMVWLSTRNLRLKLPCCKLSPKFVGPFEIIHQVNPVAYRLRLPASYRICPTFHVSLLKPVHPLGSGETPSVEPPPPLDIEGSPAYQVHALLDSRRVRSRIQYLVDWEVYGPEECSWVDAANILDPSLAEDFHRDHPNKPAPQPRGRPRLRTPGSVPRGGGFVTPRPRSGHGREPSPDF